MGMRSEGTVGRFRSIMAEVMFLSHAGAKMIGVGTGTTGIHSCERLASSTSGARRLTGQGRKVDRAAPDS